MISPVFKNAITIRLIGNLPLLFCFPLTLALFYIWSVARPTCRCRISVWAHIVPVREDKAEQHAPILLSHSSSFSPLLCRTPAPPCYCCHYSKFIVGSTISSSLPRTSPESAGRTHHGTARCRPPPCRGRTRPGTMGSMASLQSPRSPLSWALESPTPSVPAWW